MKKITFLITLLLITTLVMGQELLENGDFEPPQETGKLNANTSPWSSGVANENLQPSVNNNPNVAHTGEQFVNLSNDFTNFRQSFTADAGTEYELTFWYRFNMPQGTPDATDGIFVSIRQDTGGNGENFDPPISFYIDPTENDGNWQEVNFEFTAPQTDLLLFVIKEARESGGPNNAARMEIQKWVNHR